MAHLLHDFILEVPRQDQNVVWLGLVDRFDWVDRNVHAWRVAAVLVRVAIDGEIQEIGADTGVVEERVALSRRAIAANALSFRLGLDEDGEELVFGALRRAPWFSGKPPCRA